MKEVKLSAELLLLIIIVVLGLLGFFKKKTKKQELANFYNVSIPTLTKWLALFENDFDLISWKKRKLLTPFEVSYIKSLLGNEPDKVLSKAQIAELAHSNPKTVGDMVKRKLDKIGITFKAWKSCNYFPPTISERIVAALD